MSVSAPPSLRSSSARPASLRRRSALLVLASLSLVASACGVSRSDRDATAATITYADGSSVDIDGAELEELTREVAAADSFRAMAYGETEIAEVERDLLTRLVVREAAAKVLADAGGEPDPAVADESRTALVGQLDSFLAADPEAPSSEEVATQISGFIDVLVEIQTDQRALGAVLAADAPGVPCASHILVDDEALAQDLLAQLEDEGDFAALAAEFSTDPGSGAGGGVLGCNDPAMFVPEFADALTNGTEGEVIGPVQTQYGYHLILITGYEAATGETLAGEELQSVLEGLTVVVDDAVGIWDPATLSVTGTDS